MTDKLKCSVGVFAYNEEKQIEAMLQSLLDQSCDKIQISEILVMSSGSTDRTNEIVAELMKSCAKIKLHNSSVRAGKAAAINEFLGLAQEKIVVIANADTRLTPTCIEHLILPLQDNSTGMTGGHAVPINPDRSFTEKAAKWLWALHHQIALMSPKLGELIALRRDIVDQIDHSTAVDEASIEYLMLKKHKHIVYVPEAILYNCVPRKFSDFICQRRRINVGHLKLKKQHRYRVSTLSTHRVLKAVWQSGLVFHPLQFLYLAFCESLARTLARFDIVRGRNHHIWKMVGSTKSFKS